MKRFTFMPYLAADEGAAGGNGGMNTGNDAGQEEKDSYTRDEVLTLVQSEADKRVQQALKTQKKQFEKELSKQKSLVGLDAEAREQATKDQRISELEEQLSQFRLSNTKAEIAKVLSGRGLSAELVDFVVQSDDTEECMERIETLDKLFKAAVKTEVDNRLKTVAGTPKSSTVGLDGNITREQFSRMSLAEQSALAANNRALYDTLTKR